MEIINKKSIKSKSFAISSVMNNPRLAKVLSDAWGAPVGSTKNEKAKNVLKSLHKVNNNYSMHDGAGGPGYGDGPSYDNPNLMRLGDSPGGLNFGTSSAMLNPASPQMQQAPTSVPFGPNEAALLENSNDWSMFGTSGADAPGDNYNILGAQQGAEIDPGRRTMFVSSIDDLMPSGDSSLGSTGPAIGDTYQPPLQTLPGFDKIEVKQQFYIDKNGQLQISVPGVDYDPKPPTPEDEAAAAEEEVAVPPGDLPPGEAPEVITDLDNMTEDAIDRWYYSLTPEQQAQYADLYTAVKSGISAESWAITAMGDKDLLETLGVPQEVLDRLPKSGLLSVQKAELRDAIKAEYNLDAQLSTLQGMIGQGLTISNDLSTYIQGRDEYLGKIDSIYEDASTHIVNSDTSNPYVAQRAKNYLNYLTILKGRQNSRYTNFLNLAVNNHDAMIEQSQNLYNSILAEATAKFNDEIAITEESYNVVKSLLTDAHNMVSNQTQMWKDTVLWNEERTNAYNKNISDVLENKEKEEEINDSNYDKLDDNKIDKYILGVDENYPGVFSTYSPIDVWDKAREVNQDPELAVDAFFNTHKRAIIDLAKAGDYSSAIEKYETIMKEMKSVVDNNIERVEGGEEISEEDQWIIDYEKKLYNRMSTMLTYGLGGGLKSFLEEEANYEAVKNALEDLVGIGFFNAEERASNRDDFIKAHEKDIGELAGVLFDWYGVSIRGKDNMKEQLKSIINGDAKTFSSKMANNIARYILFSTFGAW